MNTETHFAADAETGEIVGEERLVSASGSNELLCGEDKIKDIATEFYYHWHNSGGTNTADGFDSWWNLNKTRFGFDT